MNLNKKCTCCEKNLTTKNTESRGYDTSFGFKILYLDCRACRSTVTLLTNQGREKFKLMKKGLLKVAA